MTFGVWFNTIVSATSTGGTGYDGRETAGENEGYMSLRRIERELRAELVRSGRVDLEARALDGVRFTDDGGTIYVHVFALPEWTAVREGRALVLANADYPDLQTCADWRSFMEEARLYLHDELPRVIRWLSGVA